jgi:hypothetical protein
MHPCFLSLFKEYIFTFKYGEGGQVAMDINAAAGGEGGDSKKHGARSKSEFKQVRDIPSQDRLLTGFTVSKQTNGVHAFCRQAY